MKYLVDEQIIHSRDLTWAQACDTSTIAITEPQDILGTVEYSEEFQREKEAAFKWLVEFSDADSYGFLNGFKRFFSDLYDFWDSAFSERWREYCKRI